MWGLSIIIQWSPHRSSFGLIIYFLFFSLGWSPILIGPTRWKLKLKKSLHLYNWLRWSYFSQKIRLNYKSKHILKKFTNKSLNFQKFYNLVHFRENLESIYLSILTEIAITILFFTFALCTSPTHISVVCHHLIVLITQIRSHTPEWRSAEARVGQWWWIRVGRCCWAEAKGAADHGERRRALEKGVEEEEDRPCRGGERRKGGSLEKIPAARKI